VALRLLDALIGSARRKGYKEMFARVLGTNRGMFSFLERRGFAITDSQEGAVVKIGRLRL
jgi:L-amino acid N-acyltransferase YncA